MNHCITLVGRVETGDRMRPTHDWTHMLADQYAHLGVHPAQLGNGDHVVTIRKDILDRAPYAFEHMMEFARLHKLRFAINYGKCVGCAGHPSCLSRGV